MSLRAQDAGPLDTTPLLHTELPDGWQHKVKPSPLTTKLAYAVLGAHWMAAGLLVFAACELASSSSGNPQWIPIVTVATLLCAACCWVLSPPVVSTLSGDGALVVHDVDSFTSKHQHADGCFCVLRVNGVEVLRINLEHRIRVLALAEPLAALACEWHTVVVSRETALYLQPETLSTLDQVLTWLNKQHWCEKIEWKTALGPCDPTGNIWPADRHWQTFVLSNSRQIATLNRLLLSRLLGPFDLSAWCTRFLLYSCLWLVLGALVLLAFVFVVSWVMFLLLTPVGMTLFLWLFGASCSWPSIHVFRAQEQICLTPETLLSHLRAVPLLEPYFLASAALPYSIDPSAPIGEGGCSQVFRGAHGEQPVAVKRMPSGHAQANMEIRLLSRLDHPHVVRYLHHEIAADGMLYVAMELCDMNLRQLLEQHKIDPGRDGPDVCRQMAQGLEYLHGSVALEVGAESPSFHPSCK